MRHIYILFVVLLILVLTGCNNNAVNVQDGGILDRSSPGSIEGQDDPLLMTETENGNPDEQNQLSTDIVDDKSILIGTWQDTPAIGAVDKDRYHFYKDGSYIFEYSQYDEAKRVLSEAGTWKMENNLLTLTINSKVTVEGGKKVEPFFSSEYAIENGTIRIIELSPPEIEEYILGSFSQDTKDSPGFWTVIINETQYWKYTDDPDLYLNDPVKDGDTYSS